MNDNIHNAETTSLHNIRLNDADNGKDDECLKFQGREHERARLERHSLI